MLSIILLSLGFGALAQDYIYEDRLAGAATTFSEGLSAMAFQKPASNLSEAEVDRHIKGDALFGRSFSSEATHDLSGLGPVYNNSSCNACHARDGRGALPIIPRGKEWVQLGSNEAIFLKISIEHDSTLGNSELDALGEPVPVPGFGTQLFHVGLFSVRPDHPGVGQAKVWMSYEKTQFQFPDGELLELKRPIFKITDAYNQRIYQSDVRTSPRMGPPMIGLGLLEAIPEQDILALSYRDLSSQGISGKPNYVIDIRKKMAGNSWPVSLGRFGLKANTPSVFHQSMGAFVNDMGVTTAAFPMENIFGTELFQMLGLENSDRIEVSQSVAEDIIFYSLTLGVPNRRNVNDLSVVRGAKLFNEIGCTLCHQPGFVTGPSEVPALSNQRIYPFTDMLLHDMGEGLADNRREFAAYGREWKTRPLWGIGHTQTINPRAGFLHDGRAKNLKEAIIWHGGEAEIIRNRFVVLEKTDREALIAFLNSL